MLGYFVTGSPVSFLKERFVNGVNVEPVNELDYRYCGINNSKLTIKGKVTARIALGVDSREDVTILIVPENTMITPAVLGRDALRKFELVLTKANMTDEAQEIMNINLAEIQSDPIDCLDINSGASHGARDEFRRLFIDNYVKPQRPREPRVRTELKLVVKDSQPFHCTPCRISHSEREKLQGILDRLLEKGYIRPSNSEYASPIVLPRKKNGEIRMCVDFRILNKALARDNYPLPLIEDQLEVLNGKKTF